MAEEHRCQTPEGHRLCVNNCGFFGSSTTMNLCSKCYRDLCLKEQQEASMKSTVESSLSPPSPSSLPPPSAIESISSPAIESISSPAIESIPEKSASSAVAREVDLTLETAEVVKAVNTPATEQPPSPSPLQPTRCSVCRKRVGLTGFKCRCGTTFCGTHRYPERHNCTFDFKSVGREEIAKANPLVKAAKLDKI
ncbi:PREDICTED: zinc finger A20 and AN1 domain-containing stress-associated protein 4-like [Tarenaya hassleriana]|uniref:zinc finger A20 and AN1 domain-containing stress-associated protein 4-like n=1 Tax=Tarenaya hassleriana TaxID=28532 RepID=UPI00053C9D5E|nr:PREDICTED: zinc finger A20 and AN1 domain-containing stress-associated protein 4-like [Tarenaya hassleriana]XP_010558995.1 PREDICTED: zinc finger A20 and AN1 domain-containing stress-associated protein 4-like [Tarenaya hassleriana]